MEKNLNERIKYKLSTNRMTARGACKAADISSNFLTQVINGQIKNPKPEKIERIALVLGTTYKWLMFGEGPDVIQDKGETLLDLKILMKAIERWESSPNKEVIKRLQIILNINKTPLNIFLHMVNIPEENWERYMTGKTRIPLNDALKLCLIFDLTLDWIYLGSTEKI